MHSKHICHRDLTPNNIIINPSNLHCTIVDFGVSKVFSDQEKMWTPTGTF